MEVVAVFEIPASAVGGAIGVPTAFKEEGVAGIRERGDAGFLVFVEILLGCAGGVVDAGSQGAVEVLCVGVAGRVVNALLEVCVEVLSGCAAGVCDAGFGFLVEVLLGIADGVGYAGFGLFVQPVCVCVADGVVGAGLCGTIPVLCLCITLLDSRSSRARRVVAGLWPIRCSSRVGEHEAVVHVEVVVTSPLTFLGSESGRPGLIIHGTELASCSASIVQDVCVEHLTKTWETSLFRPDVRIGTIPVAGRGASCCALFNGKRTVLEDLDTHVCRVALTVLCWGVDSSPAEWNTCLVAAWTCNGIADIAIGASDDYLEVSSPLAIVGGGSLTDWATVVNTLQDGL